MGLLHFDVLLYDRNPFTYTIHFCPRFFFINMCTYTSPKHTHTHTHTPVTYTNSTTNQHQKQEDTWSHSGHSTFTMEITYKRTFIRTIDHLTIFAISKKFPPGMCQSDVAELLLTKHLYYIDNISYIFYTILYGKLYINIYNKNEENQKP